MGLEAEKKVELVGPVNQVRLIVPGPACKSCGDLREMQLRLRLFTAVNFEAQILIGFGERLGPQAHPVLELCIRRFQFRFRVGTPCLAAAEQFQRGPGQARDHTRVGKGEEPEIEGRQCQPMLGDPPGNEAERKRNEEGNRKKAASRPGHGSGPAEQEGEPKVRASQDQTHALRCEQQGAKQREGCAGGLVVGLEAESVTAQGEPGGGCPGQQQHVGSDGISVHRRDSPGQSEDDQPKMRACPRAQHVRDDGGRQQCPTTEEYTDRTAEQVKATGSGRSPQQDCHTEEHEGQTALQGAGIARVD